MAAASAIITQAKLDDFRKDISLIITTPHNTMEATYK
jgi:hypothetical protein